MMKKSLDLISTSQYVLMVGTIKTENKFFCDLLRFIASVETLNLRMPTGTLDSKFVLCKM